ncbi:MAG: hypothetical protein L6R41_005778 [Letrouitia leprolyta]|nr:MAG: hypothetical protein L6R41_005778 [Letrouitia leprolyta]
MFLQQFLCTISLFSLLNLPSLAAVHEKLTALPHGWAHVGNPADDSTVGLQIGLRQQNLGKLQSLIYDVSTPGHPSYGNHMEKEEVDALLKPDAAAENDVLSWLKEAGVSAAHSDGHWITFVTSVGTANKLLNTQFAYYANNGVTKLRTTQYSVPDQLLKHIDLISPTTFFGKTASHAPVLSPNLPNLESRQVDASCSSTITPACLKQIYNVKYTPTGQTNSSIAFGSFLNQSARTQDLSLFEQRYNIPRQGFSVQLINGGTNDQSTSNNHGEANLDVQYIAGISAPLPITEYITGGSPPFIPNLDEPTAAQNSNEPYLDYYTYLLSLPNSKLPQVISNSYGDDEQTVPPAYAARVCNMIGQLGLRGISVLESSGDTGVGAPCQSNDGKKTPQFTPQFPGTCPFITAVGGTQSISPEVAWDASSGGFSNYFAQPSYQSAAVSNYLTNGISKATLAYYKPFFNSSGRAFPDVSAHSLTPNYAVFTNNVLTRSGGTSAACPVFAGAVALLNDARLAKGLKPLGFLNPFLYGAGATGFTDIMRGGAKGCTGVNAQTGATIPGASIIPYASWNATAGWDPVTGLGVPDFAKLLSLATAG